MINPSQRPLPDNTQHLQQTNIHALGGIRTHNLSRRAAEDLRLRQRGHWDRQITNLMHNSFIFQQYVLHYAPLHVSSSTLLIIRRINCITTASGIVTLEMG